MNNRNLATLHEVKKAIRNKYAWPGGYPLYIVMTDGESLSINAARDNWRLICAAMESGQKQDSWHVAGIDINYESYLVCCHTGLEIESAYSPVD